MDYTINTRSTRDSEGAQLFTPRAIFFGTTGNASYMALSGLLAAGVSICGVVVPAERQSGASVERLLPDPVRSPLPLAQPFVQRSIIELAWSAGLPVIAARNLAAPELLIQLAALQPAIGCVACFPQRIPASLLALPAQGFLNVHPSLLPAHRGPAPLFWMFHAGETNTGVTIHWMDESFDTGPIALQAQLTLPEGISYQVADQRLWQRATALLIEAMQALATGSLARRAQPPEATYEPWPQQEHFMLNTHWSARRAFIFMRGAANWGYPFLLRLPHTTLELSEALEYQPEAILGQPYSIAHGEVHIQFATGVLRAQGREC
jgi:methionyl-tRNA formyltransferase